MQNNRLTLRMLGIGAIDPMIGQTFSRRDRRRERDGGGPRNEMTYCLQGTSDRIGRPSLKLRADRHERRSAEKTLKIFLLEGKTGSVTEVRRSRLFSSPTLSLDR